MTSIKPAIAQSLKPTNRSITSELLEAWRPLDLRKISAAPTHEFINIVVSTRHATVDKMLITLFALNSAIKADDEVAVKRVPLEIDIPTEATLQSLKHLLLSPEGYTVSPEESFKKLVRMNGYLVVHRYHVLQTGTSFYQRLCEWLYADIIELTEALTYAHRRS